MWTSLPGFSLKADGYVVMCSFTHIYLLETLLGVRHCVRHGRENGDEDRLRFHSLGASVPNRGSRQKQVG